MSPEAIDGGFIRERVLPPFGLTAGMELTPLPGGLINRTFLVRSTGGPTGAEKAFVLQRVSPIFPRAINDNIVAVTAALERAGVPTPRLIPTLDGQTCLELAPAGGLEPPAVPVRWRLMSYIPGVSFDVISGAEQAFAAAALVARFHGALAGLDHVFAGRREGVHDTTAHLEALARALAEHRSHRLHGAVERVASEIFSAAQRLPRLPELPALAVQICHGDLKFSNVLFAGAESPLSSRALCLVDLDTVGPMALAYELGDAWRSWCNRSDEDQPEARIDLEIFAASWDGYRSALGRPLSPAQREALLLGPEWISLELAARFAADALRETYFGWDPLRFPGRGEHNLIRARGQWSLHRAFTSTRPERAQTLNIPPPNP